MDKSIEALLHAPVYVLVTVCGLVFLFVGVVGRIKDWLDPDSRSRIIAAAIGTVLIMVGLVLQRSDITVKRPASTPAVRDTLYTPAGLADPEIQKIIAEAEFKFDNALGKQKSRSEDWEIYETKLTFSACVDKPVIRRIANTRWSTWQCTIAPESWRIEPVIAWLDETAKPIAKSLPTDWQVLIRPPPDKSDVRFKAVDGANRIFLTIQVADSRNGFNGLLTIEIKS